MSNYSYASNFSISPSYSGMSKRFSDLLSDLFAIVEISTKVARMMLWFLIVTITIVVIVAIISELIAGVGVWLRAWSKERFMTLHGQTYSRDSKRTPLDHWLGIGLYDLFLKTSLVLEIDLHFSS